MMLSILRKLILQCLSWADWIDLLILCLLSIMSRPFWKMQLGGRNEQTQRVERSVEDGQENFQIKAGHARVLELGVSHKQLSHCGKKQWAPIPISLTSRAAFYFSRAGFEVSVCCDGFYECGDMAHTHTQKHTHRNTHRHYALMYVSLLLHTHSNTNILFSY